MTVYFITIVLVIIFCSIAKGRPSNVAASQLATTDYQVNYFMLAMAVSVLIFVAGLRYYVGTDYGAYYRGLNIFAPKVTESLRQVDEPILPLLATAINYFTNDGAYFIFICSAITIGLILGTTFKYTHTFAFAALLFLFYGWTGTFNGVRQYMAAAVIFAGHRYIFDKKFIKYLIVVFIAFCIHRTAIVMLIPYFVLRNKITFINLLLLSIGTAIVAYSSDMVFDFVGALKGEVLDTDDIYLSTSVNLFRVLANVAPAVFCIWLYRKKATYEETFYLNTLVINASAMVASMNSAYLARVGIYSGVFIPLALSFLIKMPDKNQEKLVKFGILLLYFIFFYVETSGSYNLSNFKWIWER